MGYYFQNYSFFPMSHITSSLLIINCFLMCQVSIPHLRWYDKFRLTALTFFSFSTSWSQVQYIYLEISGEIGNSGKYEVMEQRQSVDCICMD